MKSLISTHKVEGRNGWFDISPEIQTFHLNKTCDVCGKGFDYTEKHTFYQNIPSIHTEVLNAPPIEEFHWGFNKNQFHACDTHTEKELYDWEMKQIKKTGSSKK